MSWTLIMILNKHAQACVNVCNCVRRRMSVHVPFCWWAPVCLRARVCACARACVLARARVCLRARACVCMCGCWWCVRERECIAGRWPICMRILWACITQLVNFCFKDNRFRIYSTIGGRICLVLLWQNAHATTISTTLCDTFPTVMKQGHRPFMMVIVVCFISFLAGLVMMTDVSIYVKRSTDIDENDNVCFHRRQTSRRSNWYNMVTMQIVLDFLFIRTLKHVRPLSC